MKRGRAVEGVARPRLPASPTVASLARILEISLPAWQSRHHVGTANWGERMGVRRRRAAAGFGVSVLVGVAAFAAFTAGALAANGADGSSFVLSSYDGTTLVAMNDQNHSFTAQFG